MWVLISSDGAEGLSQLRAIDAPLQPEAVPAAEPNQGHAVRHNQIGRSQDLSKVSVVARLADAVHSGDGDEATGPAFRDPAFNLRNHIRNLYRVHTNAQHFVRRTTCGVRWAIVFRVLSAQQI